MQKILVLFVFIGLIFTACKSDDDNSGIRNLNQEDQNAADDEAIAEILNEYYLNEYGKIEFFDEEDESDDDETPLIDLAVQDPMGFWYVINPNVTGTGATVSNNQTDKILLQHNTLAFTAYKTNDNVLGYALVPFSTTVNGTGYPEYDPNYYFVENYVDEDDNPEYYYMEGFLEGIKHFQATNRNPGDSPIINLQGVIIVPSRLAYEREFNRLNVQPNTSFVINFELYQVEPRTE